MTPRSVALAILFAGLCVVGWFGLRASEWPEGGAATAAAVPEPAPAVLAEASAPRAEPAVLRTPDVGVDCSSATFPAPPASGAEEAAPRPASPRLRAAAHDMQATLRARGDDFSRAMAVWMAQDDDSANPAAQERELVRIASATSDPRVYQLAFQSCKRPQESGCDQLDARRWAALDPGNGVPWMYLLATAHAAGDESGRQEALAQLGTARRFDERAFMGVGAILDTASPRDLGAAYEFVVQTVGLSAAGTSPYAVLTETCTRGAPVDANLAQSCHAAATMLAEHADSLMARNIGTGLDFHLTGDAALRDTRRAFLERVQAGATAESLADVAPGDCGTLRSWLRYYRLSAELGQVEAVQRMAASAPVPVPTR